MNKKALIKRELAKLDGNKMLLICTSEGNPDYGQYAPLSDPEAFVINCFEQASAASRSYIGMWNLGGGNWTGGQVYDANGNQIARVSYNGRVWAEGKERMEIAIEEGAYNKFLEFYDAQYKKLMDDYCRAQGVPTHDELFATA